MLLTDFPQLKADELEIGKKVKACQLEDIYDTYIILAYTQGITDDEGFYTTEGTIVYISGRGDTRSCQEVAEQYTINNVCPAVVIQHSNFDEEYIDLVRMGLI